MPKPAASEVRYIIPQEREEVIGYLYAGDALHFRLAALSGIMYLDHVGDRNHPHIERQALRRGPCSLFTQNLLHLLAQVARSRPWTDGVRFSLRYSDWTEVSNGWFSSQSASTRRELNTHEYVATLASKCGSVSLRSAECISPDPM